MRILSTKKEIEIFSAGCPACEETIKLVNELACSSCEVRVLDMRDGEVAARAKELGVRSVPAVAIDDKLADCCAGRGPDADTLRAHGIGQQAAQVCGHDMSQRPAAGNSSGAACAQW